MTLNFVVPELIDPKMFAYHLQILIELSRPGLENLRNYGIYCFKDDSLGAIVDFGSGLNLCDALCRHIWDAC